MKLEFSKKTSAFYLCSHRRLEITSRSGVLLDKLEKKIECLVHEKTDKFLGNFWPSFFIESSLILAMYKKDSFEETFDELFECV